MTARQYISEIRSVNKLLSGNNVINDRVILSIMVGVRSTLTKQEQNKRKLWQTDTIYTNICVPLEEVPISQCCDYISELTVSRSKYRLPLIAEGNYQYAISGVFNVDVNKKLKETTPTRYINSAKLAKQLPDTFYWIYDGYLYTTNPNLKTVKLSAFFVEHDLPNYVLFPNCNCGLVRYETDDMCKNPLDRDFKLPGYLADPLKRMVYDSLMKTYFNMPGQKFDAGKDQQSKENATPPEQ